MTKYEKTMVVLLSMVAIPSAIYFSIIVALIIDIGLVEFVNLFVKV